MRKIMYLCCEGWMRFCEMIAGVEVGAERCFPLMQIERRPLRGNGAR